jgi:glutamyl-tRNA synthetase
MRERTRFAPSPTGPVHLGSLRTALYNYLYARAHDGNFVLRIEDTDRSRSKSEYENEIYEALTWLGIIPDEDFIKGGPYGPYRQSERISIYESYLKKLEQSGAEIYPCFCTPEELEQLKKEQLKTGKRVGYDRRCYSRSKEEVESWLRSGKSFSLRLKLPEGEVTFKDLLKGELRINLSSLSDPVLKRSDGSFTYHLAVVVDDIEMKITTVIRGEDHLINTAYQLLLYSYLKAKPPQFAHVALMVDERGDKLSKRTGKTGFAELKSKGILPEAVISYLLSAGAQKEELFLSLQEAVKNFRIENLPRSKTVYSYEKLLAFNRRVIQGLNEEELIRRCLKEEKCIDLDLLTLEKLSQWIKIWKENPETLNEVCEIIDLFLCTVPSFKKLDFLLVGEAEAKVLDTWVSIIETVDENVDILKELEKLAAEKSISRGKIFKTLRLILTTRTDGPPLFSIVRVLGRQKIINRTRHFLEQRKDV